LNAAELLREEPSVAFVLVGDGKDRRLLEESASRDDQAEAFVGCLEDAAPGRA
jgi:hypothetical protein